MVGPGVESFVQPRASRAHKHTPLTGNHSSFWYQEKIYRCGHTHLNVEARRIHSMRKADNGRMPAVITGNHHVTPLTCGLVFQQIGNLLYVRLDCLVAKKGGKAPNPVNDDSNNAHDDGDIKNEGLWLHAFSGG